QALDAAQVQGGRLADQGGEAHPRAGHRLLPVELGAPEAALELEHHAADAAVADQQVVAAADDVAGEWPPLGDRRAAAVVSQALGDNEDVRGPSNPKEVWKLSGS